MQHIAKPSRRTVAVGLVAAALLAGCGSNVRPPVSATLPTSLPLQPSVPQSLRGDLQQPIRAATRLAVTPSQARLLAERCATQTRPVSHAGCRKILGRLIMHCKPGTTAAGLCALFSPARGNRVLLQIVDERPDAPLCSSGPAGLCFQATVQQMVIPQQLLASLAKASLRTRLPSKGVPPKGVDLPTPGGVLSIATEAPVTAPVPAAPTGVPTPTP